MSYSVIDLAAKCKSKSELYNVLIRDGGIYLPPKQEATQKYLRSIMNGTKNYLNWKNIMVIKVPHYKGLTVKDIVEFAETQVDLNSYLPDFEYNKALNRDWLCNVINTLIPKEFQRYIDQKVTERKEAIYISLKTWVPWLNQSLLRYSRTPNLYRFWRERVTF